MLAKLQTNELELGHLPVGTLVTTIALAFCKEGAQVRTVAFVIWIRPSERF